MGRGIIYQILTIIISGHIMKLVQLEDGAVATVTNMSLLSADIRKKLMVMGVLPQTKITVIRRAPMGDPLQISVRGTSLALRKQLAEQIEVEV